MKKLSIIFILLLSSLTGIEKASAAACSPSGTLVNGYIYYAFQTAGTCQWNIPTSVSTIDYLAIGGGGGGGARHAGGGGAGGFVRGDSVSVINVSSLQIYVGNGGSGGNTNKSGQNYALGSQGETSTISLYSGSGSFTTVNAIGGGAGVTGGGQVAGTGGSGGGGYANGTSYRGQNISGQGNTGGYGLGTSPYMAGGGGGAGGAGTDVTTSTDTATGGAGNTWFSDFDKTVAKKLGYDTSTSQFNNVGNLVYFAGGGGGASSGYDGATRYGLGGTGGGGNGTTGSTGAAGAANSGSGGGGAGCCTLPLIGGDGGSGVVLIRVRNFYSVSLSTSGTILKTTKNATATTITANVISTAASSGTVAFYANGRIINGCKAISVSGTTANCTWRPMTHGNQYLSAIYNPNDGIYVGTLSSSTSSANAGKRTTSR